MKLTDVRKIQVDRRKRHRVGRGQGSGWGTTSGRGNKGAGQRSGTRFRLRFEGGQMPLYRRLPKKGFTNAPFRLRYHVVNVGDLETRFEAGAVCVNDAQVNYVALELPMGGWKESGLGVRHGAGGIRKYTRTQAVLVTRFQPFKKELHMMGYKAGTYGLVKRALRLLYGRGRRD